VIFATTATTATTTTIQTEKKLIEWSHFCYQMKKTNIFNQKHTICNSCLFARSKKLLNLFSWLRIIATTKNIVRFQE
jgi:hypothetical protein